MALQDLTFGKARKMYLADRKQELSENSLYQHQSQLRQFEEWWVEQDSDNLNELMGRDIHRFKQWRESQDVSNSTMIAQLSVLRTFLRYCERIEGVKEDLYRKIVLPSETEDDRRTRMVEESEASVILEYLSTYQYASTDHAVYQLMWHAALRIGAIRSIDVEDFNESEGFVKLVHRPDTDTPLKNKSKSERQVSLNEDTCRIISDYVKTNRIDQTDEFGRTPLFTTKNGRIGGVELRCETKLLKWYTDLNERNH